MDNRIVSVLTTTEPITVDEAKRYLRVTHTRDDSLITSMISQGRQLAETYLSKDILSRQRELYLPFVDREFDLPYAPIDTTVAITVTIDGTLQTVNEGYSTFGFENPSVRLGTTSYGRSGITRGAFYDVMVTYTTRGFGDEVKQGVLAATAFLYKAAGRADADSMANVATDYKSILAPFRKLYI